MRCLGTKTFVYLRDLNTNYSQNKIKYEVLKCNKNVCLDSRLVDSPVSVTVLVNSRNCNGKHKSFV
jgi:hypothetical protein